MAAISELLKKAVLLLKGSETATPVLDAEVLLVYAMKRLDTGFDRIKLVTHSKDTVPEEIAEIFLNYISERRLGKPVQYLTGSQEFMGLDFYVAEGVLIPRPDTEIIVEKVLSLLRNKEKVTAIDMCTGTGAIAISLAHYMKEAYVYAVDISPQAVALCQRNVEKFNLSKQIKTIQSDLFQSFSDNELESSVDLIVSNPPYIADSEISELPIGVKNFEPRLALDGGKDGLLFYRRIVAASCRYLKNGGILAFEIGYNQASEVKGIMEESGCFFDIEIEKDLAGLDRCVIGSCNTKNVFGE